MKQIECVDSLRRAAFDHYCLNLNKGFKQEYLRNADGTDLYSLGEKRKNCKRGKEEWESRIVGGMG